MGTPTSSARSPPASRSSSLITSFTLAILGGERASSVVREAAAPGASGLPGGAGRRRAGAGRSGSHRHPADSGAVRAEGMRPPRPASPRTAASFSRSGMRQRGGQRRRSRDRSGGREAGVRRHLHRRVHRQHLGPDPERPHRRGVVRGRLADLQRLSSPATRTSTSSASSPSPGRSAATAWTSPSSFAATCAGTTASRSPPMTSSSRTRRW